MLSSISQGRRAIAEAAQQVEPLESTVAHVAGVLAEMAERYATTTVRFCEGGEV